MAAMSATHLAAESAPDEAKLRRQGTLLLAVLLVLFAGVALAFRGYTCDDSYITCRYARNLVAGQGLVFNPGERVEGYSNPLWLGLLAAALRAGVEPVAASKGLGLLSALGALLFAVGIVRRLTRREGLVPPLVVVPLVCAGLAYYSMSGLETALYCCLLTGVGYCVLRGTAGGQWGAGLLALAAALTRPEGLLVLAALLALRLWQVRGLPPATRAATLWSSLAALALLACFLLWRHSYFGDLLPNTYYAKPPGAFGGDSLLFPLGYLRDFLTGTGAWLWLALGATLLPSRRARPAVAAMLLIVAVEVALVLHARGDWMALHRFLIPTLPLLVAFGYAQLVRLTPYPAVVGGVLALALLLNAAELAEQLRSFREGQYPQAVMAGQPQCQAGDWLRRNFPPDTVLACKRIGGVSYCSGLRMVDVLGLTDRRLAMIRHGSGTRGGAEQAQMAEEVFRRRPDLILLCAMKRWDRVPLEQPAPDVAGNLRDVDNELYAGLDRHGYRFLYRFPQGGTGEFVIYQRQAGR